MFELAVVVVTVGAMMYRLGEYSIVSIGYSAIVLALFVMGVGRSRQGIVFGVLAGCLLVLGALAVWRIDTPFENTIFGDRAFDAKVLTYDRRLEKTNIIVQDIEHDQKIQLTTKETVFVLPGDILTVRGAVEAPEDFVTQTGRVFEYRTYLESKGIVGLVQNPTLGPVTAQDFSLSRIPTRIRYAVADIFSEYVAFPFDGVLAGMLVGYQGGLPSYIQDLFRNTGVLHVLVLSGYNITLLAGFLGVAFKGLPFRVRTIITIIAIILLVLVSGAGVASVRAGIMGAIAVFAGLAIRTYQPLRALMVAYSIFFFVSPTTIFVDPGFHLSFLATLFIVVVLPKVETLFGWIPKTNHVDLRELIMLAVSAPLFMLPYMMYFSGIFPFSSPLANSMFALATPLVMVAGMVLIALSWITPLATFVGILLSGFGTLVLKILEWCNTIYIWQTPSLAWWGVSAIYVLVLAIVFRRELMNFFVQLYRNLRQQPSS